MRWYAAARRSQLGDSMSEEATMEQEKPIAGIGTMVFGKWDAAEVTCADPGLAPYINLTTIGTPHSGGRHANAWFGKSKLSVVERFINNLMRTGKFSGKKQHCARAFENALDNIAQRTGENPLQKFIDAIIEAAPCEEITRIKVGAVSQPKAVDSSPNRRLDIALRNIAMGSASATAKSRRTLTEGIQSELSKAAEGDITAFSVAKREEIESIAASAR